MELLQSFDIILIIWNMTLIYKNRPPADPLDSDAMITRYFKTSIVCLLAAVV